MAKKISRYLLGLSLGETAAASKGTKKPKRNGHAFHPIMNKGGAHEKSKGAQRAAAKRQTNQKVREWLGRPLPPNQSRVIELTLITCCNFYSKII